MRAAGWVPSDVATRIGLLFVGVCLIKLAMLLGFHNHLVEIHWRIDTGWFQSWTNLAAFFYLPFCSLGICGSWETVVPPKAWQPSGRPICAC